MEKKGLLDDEKFQKKLAKLSPSDRMKVEQNVKETETVVRKWRREEEALMRMPKEKRLKAICKKHLLSAINTGKLIGVGMRDKHYKDHAKWLEASAQKHVGFELTNALKKANIFPLEG